MPFVGCGKGFFVEVDRIWLRVIFVFCPLAFMALLIMIDTDAACGFALDAQVASIRMVYGL